MPVSMQKLLTSVSELTRPSLEISVVLFIRITSYFWYLKSKITSGIFSKVSNDIEILSKNVAQQYQQFFFITPKLYLHMFLSDSTREWYYSVMLSPPCYAQMGNNY